jgi:hypothetical protein
LLFVYPKFTKKVIGDLPSDVFAGALDSLYKKLIMYYTKNINLFESAGNEEGKFDLFDSFKKWIGEGGDDAESTALLEESFLMSQNEVISDEKECQGELANLLKTLKVDYINSKITALKTQLEEAEKKSDRQTTENVYSQLSELIQRKALLERF